jgi:hypothetical protein
MRHQYDALGHTLVHGNLHLHLTPVGLHYNQVAILDTEFLCGLGTDLSEGFWVNSFERTDPTLL